MTRAFSLLVLLICVAVGRADNWPAWRGPTGQGHSVEKGLPLTWGPKENVRWKIALEHPGNSTPVIWGDRIFLTQANKGGGVRSLLCLARADGKVLWQKDVAYPDPEKNWAGISYVNASAVTDGERVVVSFASAGMYCYDFEGKELWKRDDLGKWEHVFGSGASPMLYQDLAILWCGPNQNKGRNFLLAVDKRTGKTAWEHDEKTGSWSTPLLINHKGQDQLLLGMSNDVKGKPDPQTGHLKGYDPKSGKELWFCHGVDSYVYTSPLYADGVAVQMAGYGGAAIAVRLGGSGDITGDRLWQHPRNNQRVGSGVIVAGHVYMVDDNGVAHCYELTTGNDLWKSEQRVGARTWGSMVHADGRLYVLMRDGETVVLKADPKFEILANNRLGKGEQTNSSVAISDGEIYLRTFQSLWCISTKK